MKKILAMILALTLVLAMVAGCTPKAPAEPNPPAGPTDPVKPADPVKPTEPADSGNKEVVNIIVQNWDPPTSMCAMFVETMGGIMNEKSNGRLTFEYYHGGSLVGTKDTWDAIKNGVADMAWGTCSPFAGVFPISEGVGLPFNGVTCGRMATDVIWELYNEYAPLQAEYSAVHPIAIFSNTTAPVSLVSKQPQKMADFKGMTIRSANAAIALWLPAMGATPQTVPITEVYESLQKGIIEGCINDWHAINAFNLMEVCKYILDVPGSHSPIWLLMNTGTYNSLDDELKAVIDEMSNGYATKMGGDAWDYTRSWVLDAAAKKGTTVYSPSPEFYAEMEKAAQVAHQDYIKYCDGFKLNGQEIFDKYSDLINKYADQYKDPWTNYKSEFAPLMEKYYKAK